MSESVEFNHINADRDDGADFLLPTVFTAGYSGLSLPQLCAKSEELGAAVVDVRMKPFARNPDFRSGPLRAALPDRYVHIGELGNVNYKSGGPIELADEKVGLAKVEAILCSGIHVILLCGCWNVLECHRKVVADLLEKRGYPVCHLQKSDFSAGAPPPVLQPPLFS